jgi:hypothetical protein
MKAARPRTPARAPPERAATLPAPAVGRVVALVVVALMVPMGVVLRVVVGAAEVLLA